MKLIKTIIRPQKIDDVRSALEKIGVSGLTVTDVRGHGHEKGHTSIYRGREYQIDLHPKIELEVIVSDDMADDTAAAIAKAARTGEIGDGRLFVMPVEAEYHIRTGMRELR